MRAVLAGLALLVILASCVTDPRSLEMQVSPLRMDSPLSARGKVYLPIAHTAPQPTPVPTQSPTFCERNQDAHDLAELMRNHPSQRRALMKCHPLLVQVAQDRADDMLARQFSSHCDPDGKCPNFHVLAAGYPLPRRYPTNGNSIESNATNHANTLTVWRAFLNSPPHKSHLLAEAGFFREQECYGVGYAGDSKRVSWTPSFVVRAWVILTAPCP